MWLLGSDVQPYQFKHPLRGAYKPLDNGQIKKMLPALRAGDAKVKLRIVEGCMEAALNVSGQYITVLRSKRFVDDLVGAAMLGVNEAVDRLEREHESGNATPLGFIICGIHCAVAKELEADKFIKASDRTSKKHKVPTRVTSPEAVEFIFETLADKSSYGTSVEGVLDDLPTNELEEEIIKYRRDGYTDDETAEFLGVSRATVQVIRQDLHDRFKEAAGGYDNAKNARSTGTRPNKPAKDK